MNLDAGLPHVEQHLANAGLAIEFTSIQYSYEPETSRALHAMARRPSSCRTLGVCFNNIDLAYVWKLGKSLRFIIVLLVMCTGPIARFALTPDACTV